ncbi:MAG: hypothetical protein HYS45_02715 [Parcubacteria group bacterium]|nr:hypothetical protein [Parcubacteria group bacterium]
MKRTLTMLERFFIRIGPRCIHPTCRKGECGCDDCMDWMRKYGEMFGRAPGTCKECMGKTWQLKFRSIPLNENGVPVKQTRRDVAVDADGKPVRVVGASKVLPRSRKPAKKPIRAPSKSDTLPTKRDWKNRGK